MNAEEFIVEEEWVEEDFIDGQSYEEEVIEEANVEDTFKPRNLLQLSTSNADFFFDGSTTVEFDLGSYNGESSSEEWEPDNYEEACRDLIKQIYPQGGSHDEDDMIRRCDLSNLYRNLKQQQKFLVHSKKALAEKDRRPEKWESFDDSNGALSVEAVGQAIISFDEPLQEGEMRQKDGTNDQQIWPEMEDFADPWGNSIIHNDIINENRDENHAFRGGPAAVEETLDQVMMEAQGESSELELIPWLLRHADDPDDYEAACRELIPIVYKDEDETDVDTMLRRSDPKDLYRHLKHQHWYLTHTGAISKKGVSEENDEVPISRYKKCSSLDDIWLVTEKEDEEMEGGRKEKSPDSNIEETAKTSRDMNTMDEDFPVQALGEFENIAKHFGVVDGMARILGGTVGESFAQYDGSGRSMEKTKDEQEREVIKWLDRYADDPDDYEEASRKLISVLYSEDDEYDAETTLIRSSAKDLFRYLKQQYWYRVYMGTISENALEETLPTSHIASGTASRVSESTKLIDTVKNRISLLESTNFGETHQFQGIDATSSLPSPSCERVLMAAPMGTESEMWQPSGAEIVNATDKLSNSATIAHQMSSFTAHDGISGSDGMDSSETSSSLEPPPGYDSRTLIKDRTERLERVGRDNAERDEMKHTNPQSPELSSRSDFSSVYSHENNIDEIKIDGNLRHAILDQMNQDEAPKLNERHQNCGEKSEKDVVTVASGLSERSRHIGDGTHPLGSVLAGVDKSSTDGRDQHTGLQGSKRSSFTDSTSLYSNKRSKNSAKMLDGDIDFSEIRNVAVNVQTMGDEEKMMWENFVFPSIGAEGVETEAAPAPNDHGMTRVELNLDGDDTEIRVQLGGIDGENSSADETNSLDRSSGEKAAISFSASPSKPPSQEGIYQVKSPSSSSTFDRVDMAKRQNRIEEELFPIVSDAEKISGEPFSEEILAALILAATKRAHLKRYYNFVMDTFLFLPPVANIVLDGSLLDCASRHLGDEISPQYIAALKAASEKSVDRNLDYEYMDSHAVTLDITFPESAEVVQKQNISHSKLDAEEDSMALPPSDPDNDGSEQVSISLNSKVLKDGDQGELNDLAKLEEEAELLFANYKETKASLLKESAEIEQTRNLEMERIARELDSLEEFHQQVVPTGAARKDRSTEKDSLVKQLKDLKENLATARKSLEKERIHAHSAIYDEENNASMFGIFGIRRRAKDLEKEKEQQAKLMQQKIYEIKMENRIEKIESEIATVQRKYDELRDQERTQEVEIMDFSLSTDGHANTKRAALLQESREIEETIIKARNALVEGLSAVEERRGKDEAWYRTEKTAILARFPSSKIEEGTSESDPIVRQANAFVAPLEAPHDQEIERVEAKSNVECNKQLSAKTNETSQLSNDLASGEERLTDVSSEEETRQDPSGIASDHLVGTNQPVEVHSSDMDSLAPAAFLDPPPSQPRASQSLLPSAQEAKQTLIQMPRKSLSLTEDSDRGIEEEVIVSHLGEVEGTVRDHSMGLNQPNNRNESLAPLDLIEPSSQPPPDMPLLAAARQAVDYRESRPVKSQLDEKDPAMESTHAAQEGNEKKILMLFSSTTVDRSQQTNQHRAVVVLKAQNISYESMDGSDPNVVAKRNELFRLSNLRGTYPQFFIMEGESISFVGTFENIKDLNDRGLLKSLVDNREEHYRQEFMELLERDDRGETVDEDRLYHLQLYARRRVGEELSTSERLDLEEFEREEAKVESTESPRESVLRRDEAILDKAKNGDAIVARKPSSLSNDHGNGIGSFQLSSIEGKDGMDSPTTFQQTKLRGSSPSVDPSHSQSDIPSRSSNPHRLLAWRKNGKRMVAEKLQASMPKDVPRKVRDGLEETPVVSEETDILVVSKVSLPDKRERMPNERKSRKEVLAARRKQIVESRRAKWGLKSDKNASSSIIDERRTQRMEESRRLAEKTAKAREARLAREAELHRHTEQVKQKGHILMAQLENPNSAEEEDASHYRDIQRDNPVSSKEGSLLPNMVKEVERLSGFISRYEKKLETTCKSILSVVKKTGQSADLKGVLNLGLPEMYNFVTDQSWFKEHASDNFSRPLSVSKREKERIIKSHLAAFNNADDASAVGSGGPHTSIELKMYKVSKLGEQFISIDGPACGDTGRFLSSLASSESLSKKEIKRRWSDISRLAGDSQSYRICEKVEDIMTFCLSSGLIE